MRGNSVFTSETVTESETRDHLVRRVPVQGLPLRGRVIGLLRQGKHPADLYRAGSPSRDVRQRNPGERAEDDQLFAGDVRASGVRVLKNIAALLEILSHAPTS